jgi:hypothetical protein
LTLIVLGEVDDDGKGGLGFKELGLEVAQHWGGLGCGWYCGGMGLLGCCFWGILVLSGRETDDRKGGQVGRQISRLQ